MADTAANAAKNAARRSERADALLSSNEFERAINTAMEGRVKEAEIALKRSKVWRAFRETLGEGTKAQLAALGPIAWLTQQDEETGALPPQPADVMTPAPPAEGAGMPPVGPPPEVMPGVQ